MSAKQLDYLADAVCGEFSIPRRRMFDKGGHPAVMEAKKFLSLYLHEAHGVGYESVSHFLGLSKDAARLMARGLAGRKDFPYVATWQRLDKLYLAYSDHPAEILDT